MAKLICSALCSLDGYVADEHGEFAWSARSHAGTEGQRS